MLITRLLGTAERRTLDPGFSFHTPLKFGRELLSVINQSTLSVSNCPGFFQTDLLRRAGAGLGHNSGGRLKSFEQVVADSQRIRHDGESRIYRRTGDEETRIDHV